MAQKGRGKERRPVSVVVVSDVHLGTVGCHANELLNYLGSINPEVLVLNGDIIDIWQFSKYYWPKSHTKVLQRLMKMAASGVEIYYVTGNHDDLLRRFAEQHLGNFHLVNKVILELDGQKAWMFHGDVFDVVTVHSRWAARLGSMGYDALILVNRLANFLSMRLGHGRISLSKRIKDGVKSALKFIGDFEKTAIAIAMEKGFGVVACGHIHQPALKKIVSEKGRVTYMNSGDWVENLTAIEYHRGEWSLFRYRDHEKEFEGQEHADKDLEEGATGGPGGVSATVLDFTMPERSGLSQRKTNYE